jgi:antitoxin FitA
MGSVTIRNIDDAIKHSARMTAAKNGRSLEAELRALLEQTYAPPQSDHATKIRAMGSKEFIDHLIKVANGAGEGVFTDEQSEFDEFNL